MGTTLREGIGEEKLYFLLLKLVKRKKAQSCRGEVPQLLSPIVDNPLTNTSSRYLIQLGLL